MRTTFHLTSTNQLPSPKRYYIPNFLSLPHFPNNTTLNPLDPRFNIDTLTSRYCNELWLIIRSCRAIPQQRTAYAYATKRACVRRLNHRKFHSSMRLQPFAQKGAHITGGEGEGEGGHRPTDRATLIWYRNNKADRRQATRPLHDGSRWD